MTRYHGQRGGALENDANASSTSRTSTTSKAAGFPFDLKDLDTRGVHLFEIFRLFLPHVVGLKNWKHKTRTGGAAITYRKIVNVLDEAFLLLVLMNNSDLWVWEWNKKDGRLSSEEENDPPSRRFTIRTKGETRDRNPLGKGVKNTGWSNEGKQKLKDMAQEFHQLRKDNPEYEDDLDIRMNEYIKELRGKHGKKTLSSVMEESNVVEDDNDDADDHDISELEFGSGDNHFTSTFFSSHEFGRNNGTPTNTHRNACCGEDFRQ